MRQHAAVLVIDDEEIMRDILGTLLEREGYSVRLASTGQEGLELAKTLPFDAVIVDVMMPGLNGHQVLDELKKHDEELPVLMITAFASMESAAWYHMRAKSERFSFSESTPSRNLASASRGCPNAC